MDNRRPALPFLDMSRKEVSRRKRNDDEEDLSRPTGFPRTENTAAPLAGSSRPQATNHGTVHSGFERADIRSRIRPETLDRSQNVNFGRAFGIRPLEEKERERQSPPVTRRTVDDILGGKDQQTSGYGARIPKRRTINEILARQTLPDPANFHVSKIKEVRANTQEKEVRAKKPEKEVGAKAQESESVDEMKLLYTRVGVAQRHQLKSSCEIAPLLLPPNPTDDAMSPDGWTGTQGSLAPLFRNEHSVGVLNGTSVEFEGSRSGNMLEAKASHTIILSSKSLFDFSRPPQKQTSGDIVAKPFMSRSCSQWTRLNSLEALQEQEEPAVGGGDAKQAEVSLELTHSATLTLVKIKAPGEDEAAEIRNTFCQPVSCQTHVTEVETTESQTELLSRNRMWTQIPTQVSTADLRKNCSLELINAQSKGVGPDPEDDIRPRLPSLETPIQDPVTAENEKLKLEKFLEPAVKTILNALNASSREKLELPTNGAESRASESSGAELLEFEIEQENLEKFVITQVQSNGGHIACAKTHKQNTENGKTRAGDTIITIWEADNPDSPLYELRVWGQVSALNMCTPASVLVAGTDNGALNVFSTSESQDLPIRMPGDTIRSASVYTGSLEHSHHLSGILAVQVLQETDFSVQIISMDDSMIICWSCLSSIELDKNTMIGHHSASWSSLRLRMFQKIDLNEEIRRPGLRVMSLKIWQGDETHFIVGTNCGISVKGTISPPGDRSTYFLQYLNKDMTVVSSVPSVDVNSSRELYAVCTTDDYFHVIYLKRNKVVCSIKCDQRPIKIRWSQTRPCLFYTCQPKQIAVYDLLQSDLYPITTFPLKAIVDFDVLMFEGKEYLVIASENGGRLHVEKLKFKTLPLTSEEESKFRNYLLICS